MSFKGVVERTSPKPSKKPGFFSLGLLVNGSWYNLLTKWPDNVKPGDEVEFEVLNGQGTLIDFNNFKVLNKSNSPKSNYTPKPSGPTNTDGIAKLSRQVADLEGLVTLVLDKVNELSSNLQIPSEIKPTPVKKQPKKVEDEFEDDIPF